MFYKYFPESRFSFFFKPMLRYTPINELNDPFECKSSFKYICSQRLLEAYINYKTTGNNPFKNSKYNISLPSFIPKQVVIEFDGLWDENNITASEQKIRAKNRRGAKKYNKINDKSQYLDSIGILSLSRNNNNPTMWAHYASNHTGFVIGFDEKNNFFDEDVEYDHEEIEPGKYVSYVMGVNKSQPIQVTYRDTWPEEYAFDTNVLGCYWDFTNKKSSSWRYEEEWRVIVYDVQNYNEYGIPGLVDCPISAIKSVYIGLSSTERIKSIINKFNKKHPQIKIYQACLGNKSYEIIFK